MASNSCGQNHRTSICEFLQQQNELKAYKIKKHVLTGIICGGTCTCVITIVAPQPPKWLRTHDSVDCPALNSAGRATNTFSGDAAILFAEFAVKPRVKRPFRRVVVVKKTRRRWTFIRYKRLWTRDSDTKQGGSQWHATVTYRYKVEVPRLPAGLYPVWSLVTSDKKIIVSSYPVQLTDSSSHLYNILHFCWFKFELIETKAHGIVSVSYIRRDPWDPWF